MWLASIRIQLISVTEIRASFLRERKSYTFKLTSIKFNVDIAFQPVVYNPVKQELSLYSEQRYSETPNYTLRQEQARTIQSMLKEFSFGA